MEDTAMGTNENDKVGEQPLSCDQCPSVFSSLPDLEEHLETHKEERPYKCGQCEKSYRHAGSLVNHRKTHEVGLFSCLICQKDLSNSMALKNHLRTHSEDKRFQCTECGEGFRSLKQLSNHRLAVHSDISYSYAMASDEDVGSIHENLNSSMPRIRENHNLLSNLENYIAESMVPADFSHLEFKDLPEPSFSCNKSPSDGQQVQSEERRYKCNQCDKAYKHAGSLANHRQSHTTGVYQCAVCFKEFSNRMALKNHSRLHTEYKPYNCTLCDQCFRLPSELASHQKLHHTGDRPFVCEDCGQGFLTKRELHQHRRLHINIPVEAEAGKLRTSEGSENSISEEEATEPSAKIDIHQHSFQEDCKERCPEEPLSNHCCNISDLSLPEGSPCTVPQSDIQNEKAPFNQFSNNSNLQTETEISVPCVSCSEVFPNKESLIRHACKRIVVENIPHNNNHPTPNINLKEEPQSNENSEERPFRCEECGKTYRHAGSLINHKNTHQTGVYDCSICTKQLFNMAALKNHLRAHLKNRANRGLDSNLFNSTNFGPDSFNFTDASHICNICGESCASESDLQLHHMLHEDIKMPATSAAFPFLKSSPQACADEDSDKPEEGNNPMFYLDQQRVIGLAVAEQIKEMKRERGITTVPSQGDEAVSMQDQDYGTEDGILLTTGFDLKEEPCPDGTLPQQAAIDYQSPVHGEEHNHTFGEDNLSEFEGQSSQESSTDSVRRYKCNLCDRAYRHRGSLVNHKHTHQTGIYQCSICPKQYSNVMALRNHVRMHFRSPLGKCKSGIVEAGGDLFSPGIAEIYSCTKCGEAYKEEKDWHAHQLIHSSQKDLKGNQTADGLQEVTEDSIHSMSHLYNTNEESSCKDQSNFRLIPGDQVAEQIEGKDSGEERSRKEATTSEDFDSFQDHILTHKDKTVSSVKEASEAEQTATNSEISPMPDASVQETPEQMESLSRGFKVESEKRMYTCDLCGKSYRHSGSLINHKRIHQMGDYVCSVCSKQFNNLATLKNHLRSHQRSKRERMLENSEHPLFSLESNYLDVAFRDTSCEKDFSNEAEHGGQLNHHSDVEMTSDESFFASQVSLQTKMFKDLTEDLQTLHTDGPNQLSECDSSSDTKDDSINTKGIYFSDDSTSKQTRCEQKAEAKNNSNRVEGVINFGENACCTVQQAHKGQEGEKCASGVSPVQSNPSIINEEHLEGSPDLDSTEERPYKCDECGKTYRHAGSLVNHKHTHQTGIYQCSFCPKEYPNLMGLRNHIRTHTKPQFNRMGNSSSDDFFGLPGEIHQPRSGEELYDCSLCGMVFSDEGDFHQHQFSHGSPGAPPNLEVKTGLPEYAEDPYNCITDGNFGQLHLSDFSLHMHAAERDLLSRLKDEMKDMAQGEIQDISYFNESHLSHICGFCGKTYDDLESLKVHSESHSDENEAPSDEVSSCPGVDFEKLHFDVSKLSEAEGSVNKSEMIAKTHFLIDDLKVNEGPESRPYACNQCEKTYRHGGSLVNHKKTHLIGDYQCSGCSRQYPNLAAYRNHLRHHPKCKVLANTNDELKPSQTSSKSNHSNRSASVSLYPGGSVVAVEHSSSTSSKEPDAHQDHKLHSSALSQNGNDHPAEMSTKISNKKDCSIEVTNALHCAENCDDDIPGNASLDHKLKLAVPNLTSVAVIGKVDRSTEISMLDAVDTKPEICDSCGHICEGAVGLDNHKTCSCKGHSSQCPDGENSEFIFDDTKKSPTSDKKNSSQELGEGSFQQRPFRCEVCGRSYRHAGSLINHKQAHKTGLFRCGVCQKRFFNMMALKNHNRIHFEMKRYKCSDCGKAFRLQKQLLAHQKMHRDKADHARRSNRNGKREVKIPLRLLDELMLVVPSGASSDSKPGGSTAEKKVRLKQRHPKKILDPDERPYRCEQCGRSYRHAGSLLNHKRSHTMGHYCCTICDKTYPNLMAMKNHQRVHFEVKRHVCPECGKAFKWQRQLTRHQLLHTLKKYKCDLCGQNIQGKTLFEQHQMEHRKGELLQEHTGSDILEKPLNIQITSKKRKVARRRIRSFKKEIVRDHKNLSDQDNKPICKLCRYVFSTLDELEAHHCENPPNATSMTVSLPIQSTQSDPEGTTISLNQKPEDKTLKQEGANAYHTPSHPEERPYKCTVCGRTYRHAGSLLNHKNTHTLGIYKCFVCLKQFFNPMAIRNHIRIHTATKRFQCQVCGKAFRASRELITHNRVHTGERPFNCPVCQRGFSSKLSLKQHQHVHNRTGDQDKKGNLIKHPEASFNGLGDGVADLSITSTEDPADDSSMAEERPYKCSQCDRAYRHAGSLLNHKKTHTTGVYYCPTCQKQFFNLLAMKNHLRIHLNQNRYKCLDCGKAFRVSSRLASHRRIHMQGGPFPCHQCPKRFFRKSTFQKHQLLHKDREGILPQDGMAPNVLVEVT
ncbi:hypothetical protein NDU88_004042 [Pleurodeles waltl]|uniref:C2H2-type domain-containing protein n=1 Tax=Pleurodeles waltl TaxID=8319 RepID=A0AAV7PBC0_PLEWA|nr:hypothetical protein NDU88_004042 [Pleurodeles waltl]